jgi:hypothetical protein
MDVLDVKKDLVKKGSASNFYWEDEDGNYKYDAELGRNVTLADTLEDYYKKFEIGSIGAGDI